MLPQSTFSIGVFPSDIYQNQLFPRLPEKEGFGLALTCKSLLTLFHKLSLNLQYPITDPTLIALKAALSQNQRFNVLRLLGTFDLTCLTTSFESNVFTHFPPYRKNFCRHIGDSGRAYLKSLGVCDFTINQKIARGVWDADQAVEKHQQAKKKLDAVFEGGVRALAAELYPDYAANDFWQDLGNYLSQIKKNEGVQKYILCGELDLEEVCRFLKLNGGDGLDQFKDATLQEALDKGLITASFFCRASKDCQDLLLYSYKHKNFELLSALIQCAPTYFDYTGIQKALQDKWVVDALKTRKIKWEDVCQCPIYQIPLNAEKERIVPDYQLDLGGSFEEYSALCFEPIQQAIDQKKLSLAEVATLRFDELNKKIPGFYKQSSAKVDCTIQ